MRSRLALLGIVLFCVVCWCAPPSPGKLDPAKWGTDHVGKRLPEFMSGDQCLFCHRKKIGQSWPDNRHRSTIRDWDPASEQAATIRRALPAATYEKIDFVVGGRRQLRFLRRGQKYGHLELLSAAWNPKTRQLSPRDAAAWDETQFAKACAGCHASGVEQRTLAFAAVSVDCFSCHGDVSLEHTKNGKIVHLSPRGKTPPRQVAATCGQCHLRGGKSQSTARPYANQFVAGDNLFRDYRVNFSDKALARLHPGDRHIAENIRDIVVAGKQTVTCLSCHDVHAGSSQKHQGLAASNLCWNCHYPNQPRSKTRKYLKASKTCGY